MYGTDAKEQNVRYYIWAQNILEILFFISLEENQIAERKV